MHRINKVIRVAGMKRNGNHGIVNWIISQHRGNATYRNAVRRYESLGYLKSDSIEAFRDTEGLRKVDLDSACDKEIFLFTYEDHSVEEALNPEIPMRYHEWINHDITRSISIVILRDPFNFFASRIHSELNGRFSIDGWGDCFSQGHTFRLLGKWKSYARKYLEYEANKFSDEIPVSYNHWVTSRNYRENLCEKLGVKLNHDKARETVPQWGAGSSFDGDEWQNPDSYLNRWKNYEGHPTLATMKEDEELMKLSSSIFGDIFHTGV